MIISALFLAGCSESEDMPAASGNAIGFSATAPKGSRASATTTATLQDFVVYAYSDTEQIMDGVVVSRNGGSWTYSPPVYWPASTVDFYAISPKIDGREGETSTSTADDNIIRGIPYGSTDLLYAVSLNQHEQPTPVNLTFRHAMSKVAVMLSSTNSKYDVRVQYVLLKNIYLKGDYSLPNQTTSETGAVGQWSNVTQNADAMILYAAEEPISLTTTPTDVTENNLDASFFVPQKLEPFVFSKTGNFSGSYLEIDCEIIDKATGERIWPSEHTPDYLLLQSSSFGRMLFPLSTDDVASWEQGYSYVYNVVINNSYIVDTIEFQPGVIDFTTVTPY